MKSTISSRADKIETWSFRNDFDESDFDRACVPLFARLPLYEGQVRGTVFAPAKHRSIVKASVTETKNRAICPFQMPFGSR